MVQPLGKTLAIFYEVKYITSPGSSSFAPRYLPKKNESICPQKVIDKNA